MWYAMSFRRANGNGGSRRILPRGSATLVTPLGLWLFVGCCLCCLCGGGGSRGGALAAPAAAAVDAAAASEPSPRTDLPATYDSTLRRRRQQTSFSDVDGRLALEPDRSHLQSALRKLGLWLLEQAEDLQGAAVRTHSFAGSYRPHSKSAGQMKKDAMQVDSADEDIALEWEETQADDPRVVPRPWKKNFVKISNTKWSKPSAGADY